MMLCVGPVVFDIAIDVQSVSFQTASSFAKHEVVGAGPVYEDTGDDESTIEIKGTLHPYFFEGSLAGISALETARRQKVPVPVMRGDFTPLGWVLIQSIGSDHQDIDAYDGVGAEVQYTVKMVRTDQPGAGLAASILSLFQ